VWRPLPLGERGKVECPPPLGEEGKGTLGIGDKAGVLLRQSGDHLIHLASVPQLTGNRGDSPPAPAMQLMQGSHEVKGFG
jgi:hypothetical protein